MSTTLWQSLRKSYQLGKISERIFETYRTPNFDMSLIEVSKNISEREVILDKLFDLVYSFEDNARVILLNNGSRNILKNIFRKLVSIGLLQYNKGHLVAVSALCYPQTLSLLLQHFDGENFSTDELDSYNSNLHIANKLLKYFG